MTSPDVAIARRAWRQVWKGAVAWALMFGLTVASTAASYASSFPTLADRRMVAETTSKATGLAILLGPVRAVDTVGGYTVYKIFVFLTTIGAIWGVLTTTRLLRGEEDTGRWQLVLAGGTRPARATAATLAALGAAVVVLLTGTTVITAVAGASPKIGFGPGESLVYGSSIVIAPAVFVAVGAVTSQLARTRRMAAALGMVAFAVAMVLRMIGDASAATRWVRWLSPFGWTELMRPFTSNDLWPLLPAALTVAGLSIAAIAMASRRDCGAGVVSPRDVAPARPFGLASPLGLATRLEVPVLAAWCAGAAFAGLGLGIVAKIATGTSMPGSVPDMLGKFRVRGPLVDQYLGIAFLLIATVVALLPTSLLAEAADEELSGRLVNVLARPPRRSAVFAGRIGLAGGGVVIAGLLAGFATWLGARSQGVDTGLWSTTMAGLNVVPTALLALGIGALVLAVAPRAAAATVYAVVIASVTVEMLGALVWRAGWLEHVSLLHYMALAPAQDPAAPTVVLTSLLAVACCAVATLVFARRDLRSH